MQRSFKPHSLAVYFHNICMEIKLHVKRPLEGRFIVSRSYTCELKGRGLIVNLFFGHRWDWCPFSSLTNKDGMYILMIQWEDNESNKRTETKYFHPR